MRFHFFWDFISIYIYTLHKHVYVYKYYILYIVIPSLVGVLKLKILIFADKPFLRFAGDISSSFKLKSSPPACKARHSQPLDQSTWPSRERMSPLGVAMMCQLDQN